MKSLQVRTWSFAIHSAPPREVGRYGPKAHTASVESCHQVHGRQPATRSPLELEPAVLMEGWRRTTGASASKSKKESSSPFQNFCLWCRDRRQGQGRMPNFFRTHANRVLPLRLKQPSSFDGVALLDLSSCQIAFGPKWRRRIAKRELRSDKGRKDFSFLEFWTILGAWGNPRAHV
jgi:hypothetical protein